MTTDQQKADSAWLVAAEVIERFAAPTGAEDTPEFADFLAEFPTLESRGNLKVILWRLADLLRDQALPGHETYGETKGDGADYCACGEFFGVDFPPEEVERRWVEHRRALVTVSPSRPGNPAGGEPDD